MPSFYPSNGPRFARERGGGRGGKRRENTDNRDSEIGEMKRTLKIVPYPHHHS